MPRYMRIIVEAEVQIPDEIAVAAEAMNFSAGDSGEVRMIDFPLEENVERLVSQRLLNALNEASSSVRPVACSTRVRTAAGDMYQEETFGAMPVRRDDGTFADPSWNR